MMGAQPQARWTSAEFIDWSLGQSRKYELEQGRVIEMAAEQAKHALTKHAAAIALQSGVRRAGLDCTVFPDGMTVVIDDAHVRLPDAAVQCGAIDPEAVNLDQPVVLVEVVSASSAYRDETQKLIEYFQVTSVQHYLLISPDQNLVVHFRRGEAADTVETRFVSDGTIDLTPPGFSVFVADLLGKGALNTLQSN
jgi:Uma2 family endonuclease